MSFYQQKKSDNVIKSEQKRIIKAQGVELYE